jgi:NAD(P)-dependent dehydrogenase (short-subunit alcohol dehydrogenase family)
MRFGGKVAIVTGAGGVGNIGETYARALVREGASVLLADIDGEGAKLVERGITDAGGKALAITTDVSNETDVQGMVDTAVKSFGGIDILVNNAGLHLTAYSVPPTKLGYAKWRRLFDVNVHGPLLCSMACQPVMKARGGGVIINQSSTAAYSAGGSYGISKMTLNGLTVALAAEFAPDNIRVNGIAPTLVDSDAALKDLGPERTQQVINGQMLKRLGRMTDLANMLLFLCSEEASFITGHTFLVDGGAVRRPL